MGMWYKRSEAQKRFSFFFSSTTLAGAFGGLLAYGISRMEGVRGFRGWRWVFIIEGLITCVVAIANFWLLPDFPEDVKWMNEEEREFIRAKLAKDVVKAAGHIPLNARNVWAVLKDCMSNPSLRCVDLMNANDVYRQGDNWRVHVFRTHCSGIR